MWKGSLVATNTQDYQPALQFYSASLTVRHLSLNCFGFLAPGVHSHQSSFSVAPGSCFQWEKSDKPTLWYLPGTKQQTGEVSMLEC